MTKRFLFSATLLAGGLAISPAWGQTKDPVRNNPSKPAPTTVKTEAPKVEASPNGAASQPALPAAAAAPATNTAKSAADNVNNTVKNAPRDVSKNASDRNDSRDARNDRRDEPARVNEARPEPTNNSGANVNANAAAGANVNSGNANQNRRAYTANPNSAPQGNQTNINSQSRQTFHGNTARMNANLGIGWGTGNGLVFSSIAPNSAFANVGLQPGDQLVSAGGRQLTAQSDFNNYLVGVQAGQRVPLVITRNGQQQTLYWTPDQAFVQNLPAADSGQPAQANDAALAALGIQLDNQTQDAALVGGVAPGSPAARANVRPGDMIVAINGQEVHSANDAMAASSQIQPNSGVELALSRTMTVQLQPGNQPAPGNPAVNYGVSPAPVNPAPAVAAPVAPQPVIAQPAPVPAQRYTAPAQQNPPPRRGLIRNR